MKKTGRSGREAGEEAFDLAQFIKAHLPIVPVPSIPAIRMHKAHPGSGLWRLAERDEGGFGSPYWAYPWAGGLVLARHILARPETMAGRRVLDLGAGSGLVAIAAAKAGAREVAAADVDPYAIVALKLNAAANGVTIRAILDDLTIGSPPEVDVILVGDLFYAEELAARVTAFLDCCAAAGIFVLIGDPGRAFLPHARLCQLAEYPVPDMGDATTRTSQMSAVFSFAPTRAQ